MTSAVAVLPVIDIVIVALVGLCLGSFATALSSRALAGRSWVFGRSACPSCGAALRPADLVPLISWMVARGRCRHCRQPVSAFYPLMELAVSAACVMAYMAYGPGLSFIAVAVAIPFLAALIVIDIKSLILPDLLVLAVGMAGLIYAGAAAFLEPGSLQALLFFLSHVGSAFVYAALPAGAAFVLSRALKKEALGMGDIKFFAVAGLWLGFEFLPVYFIASGLAGVVGGILWRFGGRGPVFPFGPALIASLYICLVAGQAGFFRISGL